MFELYREHGSHWTKIAFLLVGRYIIKVFRSENFIKNKFYGSIRKVLRLINKVAKEEIKKRSKPIKYDSLLRII